MRLLTLLSLLLLLFPTAKADDAEKWEQWYETIADEEEADPESLDDVYELLNNLANHPININTATREELEALPFLSSCQVMDIMEYLNRYGMMKSKNELNAIESLDFYRRKLLACFITIGEKPVDKSLHLDDVAKYGESDLVAYASVPTFSRKGDSNGYLGYPYKHWLRYSFHYGKRIRFGIVASQDAGEPFMANKNNLGYDYYSPYLVVNDLGPFETLALGHYKVSTGLGLVVNMGFGFGKMSMLQSIGGKSSSIVCAHSSRSEASYMRGAAATLRLASALRLTAFASCRKADATLNDNGTVATILTSGYHRTPKEMEKKHNTTITDFGVNATFDRNDIHLGATALFTHFDRLLQPDTKALYKQYYPQGHDFLNMSIDYGYRRYPLFVSGETAIDAKGNLATLNALTLSLSRSFNIVLLHRYYSMRYTSIHSYSFSEGGRVQNESGLYAGLEWKPLYGSLVSAYLDYAYFPWPRYQVTQTSSRSIDGFFSSMVKLGKWTVVLRYRIRRHQKNTFDKTITTMLKPLVWQTDQRLRLGTVWDNGLFRVSSQVDAALSRYDDLSRGVMFSEAVGLTLRRITFNVGFKYFLTDDYDSRLYSYESGPLYAFSMPSFSGHGIRYSLLVKWKPADNLTFYAKAGVSDYFDRDVIGSDLQQISASSACTLEFQTRWRF